MGAQIQPGLARNIIKVKPAQSSTKIRMASRLPILLLLCHIPLLASALGEEEKTHEVDASSAQLQASVVKREAKQECGKRCRQKKKAGKKGKKGKPSRRRTDKGKKKGKKSKSDKRKQRQRKTNSKKKKNKTKAKKRQKKTKNQDKNKESKVDTTA